MAFSLNKNKKKHLKPQNTLENFSHKFYFKLIYYLKLYFKELCSILFTIQNIIGWLLQNRILSQSFANLKLLSRNFVVFKRWTRISLSLSHIYILVHTQTNKPHTTVTTNTLLSSLPSENDLAK